MGCKTDRLLVLLCGHACPSLCGEICAANCPQCNSKSTATPILLCPSCQCVLDVVDLDRRMISSVYTIDKNSKITGFSPLSGEFPKANCGCGAPFDAIKRYSIVKQIHQAPIVFDQLLAKLGKSLATFSKRLHFRNKEVEESFQPFCGQIRPNPLAASQNKAMVASRAQELLEVADSIQEFNVSTTIPFERSIAWLQETIPAALSSITKRTIHPTFSLRFTILHRRARNLWIFDCLRVSRYLTSLDDPSLEVQRMAELLRMRASRECWTGISECEGALTKALTAKAPAIEVEIRLQQIQLSHLLDLTLAGDADTDAAPISTMTPDAPVDSLRKAIDLCRQFPDTAGRFSKLVDGFADVGKKKNNNNSTDAKQSQIPTVLSSMPRTCNNESRKAELGWGEHLAGSLHVCARAGHAYSRETQVKANTQGCPECGRDIIKDAKIQAEQMEAEGKKAGECLFEDQFLLAMKGWGKGWERGMANLQRAKGRHEGGERRMILE